MKRIVAIITLCFLWSNAAFAQTANPQQHKYIFTVAKDGSGDYKYIQDAIDALENAVRGHDKEIMQKWGQWASIEG